MFCFNGSIFDFGSDKDVVFTWGPTNDSMGLSFSITRLTFYYVGPISLLSVDNYLNLVDKFCLFLQALETCHLSQKVICCSYEHVFFDGCPPVQVKHQDVINGCNKATFSYQSFNGRPISLDRLRTCFYFFG